ncbi:MAG: mechanosensitive ion channel family protein [Defluviitaleaceae bacterium]|nr:mechanosensitive ion channel family protein [Defluviitaleaceae bacterium]
MIQAFLTDEHFGWIITRAAVTLLATLLITKIFRLAWGVLGKDTIHQKFIQNVLSSFIWASGIFLAFSWFPQFTSVAGALLAGSGIAALTIGLAAQESLGNAFNGLFLSMFKPFEVGDRVHFVNAGITGFVEDITIRHTIIRTFTNSRVIVPNSIVNKELIENSSFSSSQASSFIDVTITYDSDVSKACEIMAQAIGSHEEFVDMRTPEQLKTSPKVPVFIRALGIYGVELRASMWTATVAINFAACSDVRRAILQGFEKSGVRIASVRTIDPLNRE